MAAGLAMPVWRYPVLRGIDPARTARAVIRDAPISFKESYEICKVLKGMKLVEAEKLLKAVIRQEVAIPYVRHNKKVGHRRALSRLWRRWRVASGRYPVKAAKYILKLLKNVENNAQNKGLDVEKLRIIHIASHRGPYLKRYEPRAFGRSTPWFGSRTSIEVVVVEEG